MYLVKFEKTIQVNEAEWRNVWVEKLFPIEATLEEIMYWVKDKQNDLPRHLKSKDDKFKLDLRGIIITQPE